MNKPTNVLPDVTFDENKTSYENVAAVLMTSAQMSDLQLHFYPRQLKFVFQICLLLLFTD